MHVNLDKPQNWRRDIAKSVDTYNRWFMKFAPHAFRDSRDKAAEDVQTALARTENMANINPDVLRRWPEVLPTLRMSTCPPLAVDRLIGLAGVPPALVKRMENNGKLPVRLKGAELDAELCKIADTIKQMVDPDIFVWLGHDIPAVEPDILRAATIVADRLCGSVANPIIRNAQEKRQLSGITDWLEENGYTQNTGGGDDFRALPPGTYSFHMNVPVGGGASNSVNISVDVVIMRRMATPGDFPLLVEAKSAGDFTNTNKRRKEEAQKINQLRQTYGDRIEYILFLCGYFDCGYLKYEAGEGIDWVWEHRINDFLEFDL